MRVPQVKLLVSAPADEQVKVSMLTGVPPRGESVMQVERRWNEELRKVATSPGVVDGSITMDQLFILPMGLLCQVRFEIETEWEAGEK